MLISGPKRQNQYELCEGQARVTAPVLYRIFPKEPLFDGSTPELVLSEGQGISLADIVGSSGQYRTTQCGINYPRNKILILIHRRPGVEYV